MGPFVISSVTLIFFVLLPVLTTSVSIILPFFPFIMGLQGKYAYILSMILVCLSVLILSNIHIFAIKVF